jgi:hypothetical protein
MGFSFPYVNTGPFIRQVWLVFGYKTQKVTVKRILELDWISHIDAHVFARAIPDTCFSSLTFILLIILKLLTGGVI